MRKKLLIVILMLVCFWHFNVKADEGELIESSSPTVGEVETSDSAAHDEKEEEASSDTASTTNGLSAVENQPNVFLEQNQGTIENPDLPEEEKIEEKNIDENNGQETDQQPGEVNNGNVLDNNDNLNTNNQEGSLDETGESIDTQVNTEPEVINHEQGGNR